MSDELFGVLSFFAPSSADVTKLPAEIKYSLVVKLINSGLLSRSGNIVRITVDGREKWRIETASREEKEKLVSVIRSISGELERTQQEFSDYVNSQNEQRIADRAQAKIDKKKERCYQLFVSAFSIALTLLIEHFGDAVNLLKVFLESARSFLQ